MRKQVMLEIHGYTVMVDITYSTRVVHTFRYSYGKILTMVPLTFPLENLRILLEKTFPKDLIEEFDLEPLLTRDYVYLLGEKRNLVCLKEKMPLEKTDITYRTQKDLDKKLLQFAQEVIESRVRHYEKIMQLEAHEVVIRYMRVARGKNYLLRKRIVVSPELIHFPIASIDALVVHELAHDKIQNHGKDFHALVEQYCPNHREKSRKLSLGIRK